MSETIENSEGNMPISSKQNGSYQTIYRHQQEQQRSIPKNSEYEYHPYYSNTTSNGGYDYVEEPNQYEEQPVQYYERRPTNSSVPIYRT